MNGVVRSERQAGEVAALLQPMRWWHVGQVRELEEQVFGSTTAWTAEDLYAELAAPHRWLQVLADDTTCDDGRQGGDGPAPSGETTPAETAAVSRVVGYIDVSVQGRDADLMTVVVAPTHRGRGYGATLLDAGIDWARQREAHHMFLEVDPDNPAQALYVSRGFDVIDRRRAYYADGRDALVMRLALHEREAGV